MQRGVALKIGMSSGGGAVIKTTDRKKKIKDPSKISLVEYANHVCHPSHQKQSQDT
jgi:hypothetical protein